MDTVEPPGCPTDPGAPLAHLLLTGTCRALTEDGIDDIIVFGPDPVLPTTTWWWLAIAGPHTSTPLALAMGLGSGAVVPFATAWHRGLGQGPLERVVAHGVGSCDQWCEEQSTEGVAGA